MTIQFTSDVRQAGVVQKITEEKRGFISRVLSDAEQKRLDALPPDEKALAFALADLRALADDTRDLVVTSDEVWLSHELVARLDDETARQIGLPPLVDLVFEATSDGTLGSPNFRLLYRWLKGGRQVQVRRQGAILDTSDGQRRLSLPIYQAVEIADAFDVSKPLIDHWDGLARFRQSLEPDAEGPPERPDFAARAQMTEWLSGLRIQSADSFSLSVFEGEGGLDFDPLPFSRLRLSQDRVLDEVSEAQTELKGQDLSEFQSKFRERGAIPAFRLGDNSFLTIDPAAAPVLDVIAKKQRAAPIDRDAFARNPRPAISQAIEAHLARNRAFDGLSPEEYEGLIEEEAEPRFIETPEYSRRVTGLGRWEKPELPPPPITATTWLPEVFEESVAQTIEAMALPELKALLEAAEEAVAEGASQIDWKGTTVPLNPEQLKAIKHHVDQQAEGIEQSEQEQQPSLDDGAGPIVVKTKDNFEVLNWQPDLSPRRAFVPDEVPTEVRTVLMPHQEEGFRWALDAWKSGLPGIMNADEQGLGKTLQTLAFLSWLKSNMQRGGGDAARPFLIVAPTSLLGNWEAEVERHLAPYALGAEISLYGGALRSRKVEGATGRETDEGSEHLDLKSIDAKIKEGRGHDLWVLTTYQTLTNYQHSLAHIEFAAVVFDEIQAVKNPGTLRAAAARAVNADFRIGLTGTPLENRPSDVWAIMDQLNPGALQSLRTFNEAFGHADEDAMRQLHHLIFSSSGERPPLSLRRMKRDAARDLPIKERFLHPCLMPAVQAEHYEKARDKLAAGRRGGALSMLHHIRAVSVHPDLGVATNGNHEEFLAASARLMTTMAILRSIAARQERALVFIEHRRVQERFREIVRASFGLERVDIINGSTPIPQRQAIVSRFQRHLEHDEGFDLLILGPRAAGTGLTLTAANHVIHLSRWWNPAVEEQCNDRVHRIGQDRAVSIHIPLALHPRYLTQSFDCLLQTLMERKRGLARKVLWPSGDTEEDVAELVQGLEGSRNTQDGHGRALDRADLLEVVSRFDRFRQPSQRTPKVYEVEPSDPRGASIVLTFDDGEGTLSDLRALSNGDRRIAAAYVLAQEGKEEIGSTRSIGEIPVSVLAGESLEAWPDFALLEE